MGDSQSHATKGTQVKISDLGIAAIGGMASNLLVWLPLSCRLGMMKAGQLTITQLMKTAAVQRIYLAQNEAHRRQVAEVDARQELTAIPDGRGQQVSLFYSGGADSTYSAALLAQRFDRVHLLTFTHDGMGNSQKPKINADRLQERFGDRIVWHLVDGNDLWRQLYLDDFARERARYGAFLNTGACECCYLSWNAIAAVYNRRHGITHLAVGIDRDHSGFIYSAGDEGIEVMRRFHAEYGVHFFLPVYDEPQTDVRLYEMGITSEKHTRRPYQFYTTATTQGTCEFGLGHRLFAQYTVVRHSPDARQAMAHAYFGEKLEICRHYVAETLEQDRPLPLVF
jgi:hypothetical protein